MKLVLVISAALFALGQPGWGSEPLSVAPAGYQAATLHIAPSSSRMLGGTAKLVVGTLSRNGLAYVGDYRIKVVPYFFKNETGKLSIKVPDVALDHMVSGAVTNFNGRATTNGSGLTRRVTAKAMPSTNDRGELTFTVVTENGPLVFNTSYRIDKR